MKRLVVAGQCQQPRSDVQRGSPENRQAPTPGCAGRPDAETVPGRDRRTQDDPAVGRLGSAGRERSMIAPTSAASSSAVGVPRTTRNAGSSSGTARESDMPRGYDAGPGASGLGTTGERQVAQDDGGTSHMGGYVSLRVPLV